MANVSNTQLNQLPPLETPELSVTTFRLFSWCTIAVLFTFLLNNYLTNWLSWPGAGLHFQNSEIDIKVALAAYMQFSLYVLGMLLAAAYVLRTRLLPLRADSRRIYGITAFIIRASFWAVLLIGLADMIISFLRVEALLEAYVGSQTAVDLGRPSFRGMYVHFPMLGLALLISLFHKDLGFPWLALLVVVAELLIVITRFIFSYEQAFMGDLVRFWYAALFLFASAHTLIEEGHVRVDLFYAGLSKSAKGFVNAFGSILLGMSLCWVVVFYGMQSNTSIINSPLLAFEVTQTGFGMYVKYWMAAFLAIFAVSMLIQFSGYFLEGMADYRGDPDDRDQEEHKEAI